MFFNLKSTKYVYLMRHAKAEEGWDKSDFERDLHPKGYRRIAEAAAMCKQHNVEADIILASAAHRTVQTAQAMTEALGWQSQSLHVDETLYLCPAETILERLYVLENNVQHVWVVGHNPGISDLAYLLHNSINTSWLPTAGIVALAFKMNRWVDLSKTSSQSIFTFLG